MVALYIYVKYISNQLWKQKENFWSHFIKKNVLGTQDPKKIKAKYRMWKTKYQNV